TFNMRIAKWISILCGCLAPALIPPAHIAVLWYFWKNYSRYVDRRFCSCSCWDTVFKGPYESGIASYKHIYFNATQNTLKIWILIVVGILAFYESIKQLKPNICFFLVTELIATGIILYLANSHNKVTQRKVLCIVGISLIHITAGSFDQFVANVIRGEGYAHQVVRDVSFMIPD
uniref:Uncharacterized protein n=1 Tax=Megaselia scalaris TaxID=36166 RepID=T1H657_MEGSC